jgi:DNA-binding GntR family transcriptional regulator
MPDIPAVDSVYQSLRDGILGGQYSPGIRLGEVELAKALGVSRTPVREALRRLDADGLIETAPNRGARVRTWNTAQVGDVFAIRAILEGHAAALAAQHGTPAQVEHMAALCDRMESAARPGRSQNLQKLTDLNNEFHGAIHAASGNSLLPGMIHSLIQVPLVLRTFRTYTPKRRQLSMQQHRDIVAALVERDPTWAEASMRMHVLAARSTLLGKDG